MSNEQMISVPRHQLERATDNKHLEKERISIYRHEALCQLRALLAQPAAQHQGEPILTQAVAVTRKDDDEGLRLEWLLEGGISELEFAGQVLFAMPEANDLCDEDGSAEVFLHPPTSEGFSAEQMTAQAADGYRNGIKAAAELAEAYPELAQAIRALPLPQ